MGTRLKGISLLERRVDDHGEGFLRLFWIEQGVNEVEQISQ